MQKMAILPLFLTACPSVEYVTERVACGTLGHSTSFGGSSTGGYVDLGTPALPDVGSSYMCPLLTDGPVEFCFGSVCRSVLVANASGADGSGPLALHWHGTYEWPEGVLAWDSAAMNVRQMVTRENGLMVLPYADPEAVNRPENPFPWWTACGTVAPSQCEREDDFVLAELIADCAVEQGLVSPERLTTSGMSAGGVMVTALVDRSDTFSGAVVWSGGLPSWRQPSTPSGSTAIVGIHGGATDEYCGEGVSTCFNFVQPTTEVVRTTVAAGGFGFLCDHQAGHAAAMGSTGAEFIAASRASGHLWAGYPFGYPGTGFDWMLNHYCYPADGASPW